MKKLLTSILLLFAVFACGKKNEVVLTEDTGNVEKLVIGATPIPHKEILELIKDDLLNDGVDLEIVEFNDYIQPNQLLGTGELDANFFQHVPYMDNFAKEHNLNLVSIGGVHLEPIALYSKKIKNIDELKNGDTILISNDPSNGGRALILLDEAGIIKLDDNTNLTATVDNIVENEKNLEIVRLSPEQLASRLDEVAAAVINTNFALNANLSLSNDSILIEGSESPYVNIVTVLGGREGEEKFKKLMKALQSDKVKTFIEENYNGEVLPTFTN